MNNTDTICALATSPGGALGIIRISGDDAINIACSICSNISTETPANTVHYSHIVNTSGELIDEAMVSIFRAPHSYSGEDSVEMTCHGSRYILNKVLETLVQQGCRMAGPGEYTMRAYLNGKMDLSQAEAVADLIASTNAATHKMAMSQLKGGISSELSQLRERLLHLTTLLELELDFSDHEDLEFADRKELLSLSHTIDQRICALAKSFEAGQALKRGIPVAIVGKTNTGKSTLLNRFLKDDRAIVSDVHGTTRDTIEDSIEIKGVNFRIIDTAGIRNTDDQIEQIGIQRTFSAIEKAHIVVWIMDTMPNQDEVENILELSKDKALIPVWNKSDLTTTHCQDIPGITTSPINISAKFGDNLKALEEAIYKSANIPDLTDVDIIVSSTRQYQELRTAHNSVLKVIESIEANLSSDLIAEELKMAIERLANITGTDIITPQDTLNNIFSSFCVGK